MSISPLLVSVVVAAAIPLLLLAGASLAGLQSRSVTITESMRWQCAWRASQLVAVFTALLIAGVAWYGSPELPFFSIDPLRLSLLTLLSVMALVVVKFSRRYLASDPGFGRYLRWLLLTLAAVALVFISDHLLLFAAGWIAISLSLHQLLMFFPERPRAALAAHKKFLLARVAEASLIAAFYLLYQQHGTAIISDIVAAYQVPVTLSWQEQLAAVLIALTALIKCAQLPVHGWLMQVVEAPTPVSALLHAGVINLGGFLLILFAPLFLQVPAAQWLVLIVAGLTTVLAALIMTTRISIKVRLAWSTSAQMGLMLVECALGLVELALLHLLAHSAYKAHAFLSAGSEVQAHVRQSLVSVVPPTLRHWALALVAASAMTLAAWWATLSLHAVYQPVSGWLLLALALTVLVAVRSAATGWLGSLVIATGVTSAYTLLKTGLHFVSEPLSSDLLPTMFSAPDLWALGLFAMLFALWWALRWRAHWRWVQKLSTALFAGLYLDEWFTRTTLMIWPARLPQRANPKKSIQLNEYEEKVS